MHPGTLSDAYLQVNTSAAPGRGITGQTMQFHGTADRYTLNGATTVATLFSTATNATTRIRGHAAERRYERWSGGRVHLRPRPLDRLYEARQPRLGRPGTRRFRADPVGRLFFPDWVDLNKVAIPQADEQQRLLANLIGT